MRKLSEINEGVFRNSIIRTSGTKMQRREDEIDYTPIDLGLPSGTLWCDRNAGAISPEDYGGYFYWGGTEDMRDKYCDLKTYPFYDYDSGEPTKYTPDDGIYTLEPEDDAATAHMGGDWHMPTMDQCEELLKYTSSEKTKVNGVKGFLLKSKRNQSSIFIPLSGYRYDSYLSNDGDNAYIWSNSINSMDEEMNPCVICIIENDLAVNDLSRYFCFSVRGVMDNK